MGCLDQYLEARQYVSKKKWLDDGLYEDNPDYGTLRPVLQNDLIDPDASSGITLEYNAAQWRKANGIHRWMEVNLAFPDGMENCQSYPISGEQLKELREACNCVLSATSDKTEEVAGDFDLSPMQGFFFGTYRPPPSWFDEWYFRDLEQTVETINRLDRAGALNPDSDVTFTYRAWW